MKWSGPISPEGSLQQTTLEPRDSVVYSRGVFAAVLATALLLLLLLEFRSPYYFLQDDGRQEFLPAFFHNWRSLLSGHLPLYDFHIFGGLPHASMGQTAVFYIPQYIAMFLSETIWGHPFAAIDLLAFMHGLLAVAGGYALLRYLGTSDMAAAFGGLTAFTGFFVWAGRSWPSVLILCAWFPWMVWASLRFLEKPGAGHAGWLMFFRLGLLYGGYPHFFILAMIFEHFFGLGHLLMVRRPGWRRRYFEYLAIYLPTALLGLPFFLPGIAEVKRSLERSAPMTYTAYSYYGLNPIFWVFGQLLVFINLRGPKDYFPASLPYLSYLGFLPSLLPFGVAALWKKRHESRPWIAASGFCLLLALLWSWNVISPLMYHLPVMNRLRDPFKLIYFAGFFQCLIAALVLTRFSKRWQRVAIAGSAVNWIVVFCFLPNHAWRVRNYPVPLNSPWQQSLKDGRYFVISRTPILYASGQLVEFDYAQLWGLDNLLGYEPLLSRYDARISLGGKTPQLYAGSYGGTVDQPLLDHLKKWSVKYVLVGPTRTYDSGKLSGAGFQKQEVKQGWTLWKDPNALSRVRWSDASGNASSSAGIRWDEHVNSIDVYLSQWPTRQLVMAFTANPGLETCIERHCTAVPRSADGLIRVDVPPGTPHVRLVYHNGLFLPSILIALATLAVYLLLLFRSRRQSSRKKLEIENEQEGAGPA
jgi:hypothetical protein